MAHAHPNPNPNDDPNPVPVVLWGIIGSLLVVVSVYALAGLDGKVQYDLQRDRLYSGNYTEYSDLAATQKSEVNSYDWVDQQADIVRVPVETVFDSVARELAESRDGRGPWSARQSEGG